LRVTDELISALESRVIDIEEVLAIRWPLRMVAAARLGRAIRQSANRLAWAGPGFAARRTEDTTNAWLSERAGDAR